MCAGARRGLCAACVVHVAVAEHNEMRVERVLRRIRVRLVRALPAQVVVGGGDMVHVTVDGERALEAGRDAGREVAGRVDEDAGPAEHGRPRAVHPAGRVFEQPARRVCVADDLAPVRAHVLAQERFCAVQLRRSIWAWAVVVDSCCGMDEIVIWAQVQVVCLVESGEREAERVCMMKFRSIATVAKGALESAVSRKDFQGLYYGMFDVV